MEIISSIQVLRGLAALSVAACHYGLFHSMIYVKDQGLPLAFGEAGVDLFFVISGFIMVYASGNSAGKPGASREFVLRRLIRIAPIYWTFTLAYLLVAFALPQFEKSIEPWFVISSFAFFPAPRPDGAMQPLVGQGWSLNYEMLFYVIFAIALLLPTLRNAAVAAILMICGLASAGALFEFQSPVLKFWTSPIIVEFSFGMAIALAYLSGVRLPRWLGWSSLFLGFSLFLAAPQLHDLLNGRLIPWGVPAALLVAAPTLSNLSSAGFGWRVWVFIGEISYSLYLSHAIVIRGAFSVIRKLGWDLPYWSGLIFHMTACVLVAALLYMTVERPLTRLLRKGLDRHLAQSRRAYLQQAG